MYGDDCCRIKKLSNGFTVEVRDPAIVKANKKRDAMPYSEKSPRPPYQNPEREYVFKTSKEVTDFLTKNLDKMLPEEDYESSFDAAVEASTGEDD